MKCVEQSQPEDRDAILAVLTAAGLPTSDLVGGTAVEFLVVRRDENVVGVVGLEHAGAHALLRSLAVHPDARDRGLGHTLVDAIQEHASDKGFSMLFLLTTTAADFFVRRGFRHVERMEVPADIQGTQQFAGLCPASAVVMVKELDRRCA